MTRHSCFQLSQHTINLPLRGPACDPKRKSKLLAREVMINQARPDGLLWSGTERKNQGSSFLFELINMLFVTSFNPRHLCKPHNYRNTNFRGNGIDSTKRIALELAYCAKIKMLFVAPYAAIKYAMGTFLNIFYLLSCRCDLAFRSTVPLVGTCIPGGGNAVGLPKGVLRGKGVAIECWRCKWLSGLEKLISLDQVHQFCQSS